MRENSFIDKFNTHISENRLFRNTETILLAVSGGIDSVVMAELFYQCKLNFGIAHCNFQLRDEDSNADEKFAKEIAEKYDVAFYDKRFDTIKFQKENKLSLEEAARILRYEWLEGIRSAFNYNFIATAHHINDSIETIILNLTKGTGIRGLKGIPVKNGFVVRPLLFAAREEIEIFAKENNLQYRTDKTNLNNDFQRNKIRNLVIPVLKEINPALEKTFHKNIKHFIDAELLYKEQIEKKVKKLLDRRKDAIYIPINTLKTLPASATYLFEIVKQFNFSDDQSEEVHENLFGSGKQFFSSTHRLIVDRKFLIITSVNTEDSKHIII
ncbi:MAG: tRNA lysidine(34) synthetase TilS, partial [Fimbriimonadaceae bacterium]|nr:tRNA lysidine(34) synthetase TilS [Chitinophagales bacterium]